MTTKDAMVNKNLLMTDIIFMLWLLVSRALLFSAMTAAAADGDDEAYGKCDDRMVSSKTNWCWMVMWAV